MPTAVPKTAADLAAALAAPHPLPLNAEQVRGLLHPTAEAGMAAGMPFAGIAFDSRKAMPGDLFVALRGETVDGHDYLQDAWERGARGVVVETPDPRIPLPYFQIPDSRRALSVLADAAFGYPSAHLTCVGLTGTKGKTSTSYFTQHLLQTAGHPCGVIGTLGIHAHGVTMPLPLTTPESLDLQRMLACLRALGCTHATMEVSAHGIHFQRTRDIRFARAIFTNLGQDHLDFFGTMEAYAAAKRRLFEEQLLEVPGAIALINADDPLGKTLIKSLGADRAIGYGTGHDAQVHGQLLAQRPDGLLCRVRFRGGEEAELLAPVHGAFSLHNLLAAASCAESFGIPVPRIAEGLVTLPPVPGRHEVVSTAADDIRVIVDYAHTPQSVAAILASADREHHRPIIALVGCGGDRDRTKRPQMGRLAYEATDLLVITSDNPRSEDPQAIIEEVCAGVPADDLGRRVKVQVDRGRAIAETIASAPAGAAIYILGKGHEPYQILQDRTIEFDDRIHARQALEARRRARIGAAL
ncbi:MAG TPA: UDP-N-acetylmuramoyl-L-alanyl-D-glutamate--2,6-diaminopimelate ligase [bacterium]|nr:UDP-N-acetylmuramoyl-L-alanyl-D-glutamate--2,6-diaminopimelate ligase [bacterium]